MSKEILYRQCRLIKIIPEGTKHQVSWLPEKYAILDKILKLRDPDGYWDNGWRVEVAGEHLVSEDALPDSHHDIKQHRIATGDSLPKVSKGK